MNTVEIFKKAVKRCYEDGEIDKIIRLNTSDMEIYGFTRRYVMQERKRAREDKKFLRHVNNTTGIDKAPFIPLLMGFKSTEVLRNIVSIMVLVESEEKEKNE